MCESPAERVSRRLPSFDRQSWPDQNASWQELVESLFPIHQGIVQSGGDGKLVMPFTDGVAEYMHLVANDAVTRDGKAASLGDLQAGDHGRVTSEEQAGIRAVTKIDATSAAVFNGYPLEETKPQ